MRYQAFTGHVHSASSPHRLRPRVLVYLVPEGLLALCLNISVSLKILTAYLGPLTIQSIRHPNVLFQVVHLYLLDCMPTSGLVATSVSSATASCDSTDRLSKVHLRSDIQRNQSRHAYSPVDGCGCQVLGFCNTPTHLRQGHSSLHTLDHDTWVSAAAFRNRGQFLRFYQVLPIARFRWFPTA